MGMQDLGGPKDLGRRGGGEPQGNCGAGEYVNHEKGKGKVSQKELDT